MTITFVSLVSVTAVVPTVAAMETSTPVPPQILAQSMYISQLEFMSRDFARTLHGRGTEKIIQTPIHGFPVSENKAPVRSQRFLMTAYSSTPDQTNGDPFITASGVRVHKGVVACNALPIGTKFIIPGYSDDFVYTVYDRHATHLTDRIDIWFETRDEAIRFGTHVYDIQIL